MNNERIVVTTSVGGRTRSEIWDTASPLGIGHPYGWVLERTGDGVTAIAVRGGSGPVADACRRVANSGLSSGSAFQLPVDGSSVEVHLKQVPRIKPAYLLRPQSFEGGRIEETAALIAFAGVRKTTVSCQRVHTAYVGYAKGRPIFTVLQQANGIQVKPLVGGVYLKLKHRPATRGQSGSDWTLTADQAVAATITHRWYWWRFNIVPASSFLSDPANVAPQEDGESRWFGKVLGTLLALTGIFSVANFFLVKVPEEKIVETPTGQVVRFRAARPRTVAPQVGKVAAAPGTPKAAPAAAPKGPEKSAHAPDAKKALRQVMAARQLREALGGAMALMQKGAARGLNRALAPKPTSEIFGSRTSTLTPTEIKPGFIGSNARVGSVGGSGGGTGTGAGAGGVGYGTGARGTIQGQGSGFVSMEPGGSMVEEGLTKDEVGAVIHKHMSEIRYCYDSAMVHQPSIEGKLIVRFVITPKGAVKSVKAQSSTLNEPQLGDCIMARLQGWKFPTPKGGVMVNVSYPFVFKTLGRE